MRLRYVVAIGILLMSLLILAAQCPDSNSRPVAIFSADPTSGPSPLAVDFDASGSYDPDGTVVVYSWDFGDGASETGVTTSHTFTTTTDKTYTVRLTVTDDGGKSATTSATISVTGSGGTLFFDDFEDGADPAWVATPPGWAAGGGHYNFYPQSWAEWKVGYSFVATGKNWQNYAVEADIYLPDRGMNYPSVGIVLRAQEDLNNMVIVWCHVLQIRWQVIENGEEVASSDIITPGVSVGWQHVRVEVAGTMYKLYVEGLLRTTFTDSGFITGMPGVAGNDVKIVMAATAAVDNFKVTSE